MPHQNLSQSPTLEVLSSTPNDFERMYEVDRGPFVRWFANIFVSIIPRPFQWLIQKWVPSPLPKHCATTTVCAFYPYLSAGYPPRFLYAIHAHHYARAISLYDIRDLSGIQ